MIKYEKYNELCECNGEVKKAEKWEKIFGVASDATRALPILGSAFISQGKPVAGVTAMAAGTAITKVLGALEKHQESKVVELCGEILAGANQAEAENKAYEEYKNGLER